MASSEAKDESKWPPRDILYGGQHSINIQTSRSIKAFGLEDDIHFGLTNGSLDGEYSMTNGPHKLLNKPSQLPYLEVIVEEGWSNNIYTMLGNN